MKTGEKPDFLNTKRVEGSGRGAPGLDPFPFLWYKEPFPATRRLASNLGECYNLPARGAYSRKNRGKKRPFLRRDREKSSAYSLKQNFFKNLTVSYGIFREFLL
ncbi:hypothetical protein D7X94_11810 [Acutalibacter sp. 1XD8-33]|nr:hypothetical protein D7X94_11810 [Acutalibacter sp. 1XD8-33]